MYSIWISRRLKTDINGQILDTFVEDWQFLKPFLHIYILVSFLSYDKNYVVGIPARIVTKYLYITLCKSRFTLQGRLKDQIGKPHFSLHFRLNVCGCCDEIPFKFNSFLHCVVCPILGQSKYIIETKFNSNYKVTNIYSTKASLECL